MKDSPTTLACIDELHCRLEMLARKSNWSELADLMKQRDDLLLLVEPDSQNEIFRAAVRNNDRVSKLVRAGRQNVSERLLTLRRGQGAMDHYTLNSDPKNPA